VSSEKGTALWNGEDEPVLDAEVNVDVPPRSPYSGIAGALQVFVQALRTGHRPSGEVHENVMSLAMVEAAVRSATSGRAERLDDVLEQAHAQARRDEARADVRGILDGWSSAREALRLLVPDAESMDRR
jgi:hypothetical protein